MKLGERLVRNLARRNMEAFYCPTTEVATAKVMALMPQGSSVTWGGSMSIRDMGLTETIAASGRYEVFDRDKAAGPDEAQEIYRKAFGCDFFISSANAISEDGEIVNIDGNGNRVAAITFGPKNVVFVIGINKVCRDCEAAVKRRDTMPHRRRMPQLQLERLHLQLHSHSAKLAEGQAQGGDCRRGAGLLTMLRVQARLIANGERSYKTRD